MSSQPAENVPLGAGLIVIAFLLVAIMSALGKAAGVSTSAIVFFENLWQRPQSPAPTSSAS
ncbi:MAG TPA: hypothetical protein VG326_07975 [Tepidisphaeraceae bacterium]|nr:hypothetical protein [Tepidisphaeraceae bacterium]